MPDGKRDAGFRPLRHSSRQDVYRQRFHAGAVGRSGGFGPKGTGSSIDGMQASAAVLRKSLPTCAGCLQRHLCHHQRFSSAPAIRLAAIRIPTARKLQTGSVCHAEKRRCRTTKPRFRSAHAQSRAFVRTQTAFREKMLVQPAESGDLCRRWSLWRLSGKT